MKEVWIWLVSVLVSDRFEKIILLVTLQALAPTALAQAEAPIQVEIGSSLDTFDKSYMANWRGNYVDVEKKLGERRAVYGSLRESERYGMKDTEMLAGIYHPLAARWTLLTEGNVSPSHNVLAKWSAMEQIQYSLDDGWGVQLGLRHTEYDSAVINIVQVVGERYWSNYRAAYTHTISALTYDGYASNDRVQLSRYYAERSWVGIGISLGAEIENVGPPLGVLSTTVRNTGLNGRHWLNRDWAIFYEAYVNQQGSLYTRNGLRFGLRHEF